MVGKNVKEDGMRLLTGLFATFLLLASPPIYAGDDEKTYNHVHFQVEVSICV